MTSDSLDSTVGEKDEEFYWIHMSFLVEGHIFRVPSYPFIHNSSDFANKDYREDDVIALPDVTVEEFKCFLRYLFPRPPSTAGSLICFDKQGWLHILKLSTLWHLSEERSIAKSHLAPQMHDPFEFIKLGRLHFISSWVLTGYADLALSTQILNEGESELIGHKSTVRLYIMREKVRLWDGVGSFHDFLYDQLRSVFHDEIPDLERRELDLKTKDEVLSAEAAAREQDAKRKESEERVKRETKIERRRSNEIQKRLGISGGG